MSIGSKNGKVQNKLALLLKVKRFEGKFTYVLLYALGKNPTRLKWFSVFKQRKIFISDISQVLAKVA
jgi:hypothetical protein